MSDGGLLNPYLLAVLLLAPMGVVMTGLAYLFASPLLAFVFGTGFAGALLTMLGYGLRGRRTTTAEHA